jgi:hypothetical protein
METQIAFYISTGGDDRWSGRLPVPDAHQNDSSPALELGFVPIDFCKIGIRPKRNI